MAGELTLLMIITNSFTTPYNADGAHMLAGRTPHQVGDPLSAVHPDRVVEHVKQVLYALRIGESDVVSMPAQTGPNQHVMHYYRAMRDENRRYRGVNELVIDIMPILKYYLQLLVRKLVKDPDAVPMSPITGLDSVTGASAHSTPATDATSGASASKSAEKPVENRLLMLLAVLLNQVQRLHPQLRKNPDTDALTGASEETTTDYTATEDSAPAKQPEVKPEPEATGYGRNNRCITKS